MRARTALLAAALVVGGCGSSSDTVTVTRTETETVTRTETTAADATALPDAVEETRRGILAAAEAKDWDALEPYVTDRLNYTFGGPVEGGAIAYWKRLEAKGEDPLGTLARILQLPSTLTQGTYIWPWAYSVQQSELTAYEKQLLGDLADDYVDGSYYGWRAGIAPDGTWTFFVAGD
ncbi:MAG: hypothetical protein ACM33B_09435 [Pseudomonadota bacterium]